MAHLVSVFVLLVLSSTAYGLDICLEYKSIHKVKVIPKLESGIPFRMQSILISRRGEAKKKIVRLTYDLWDERVEVTDENGRVFRATLSGSDRPICQALSFENFEPRSAYTVSIMLNVPAKSLSRILREQLQKNSRGILSINWTPLQKKALKKSLLYHREFK